MEAIKEFIQTYYLVFKWLHVFMVAAWTWSTAVAYRYYVVPAYLDWLKNPQDPIAKNLRNYTVEQFDKGVIIEHIAFPIIIITGPLMVWAQGWPLDAVNWLTIKLAMVILIFIPMEVVDYHISHFNGRKSLAAAAGDEELFEQRMAYHWKFFLVTAPLVRIFIPLIFYFAIVKPFS